MKIKRLSLCALFTAAIAVSAQIIIPTPLGVPLSAVTLMIFIICFVCPELSFSSVCVYLLCGVAGLGVFSGFTGGLGIILSPVGGYLIGYIPMSLLCSVNCTSGLTRALLCILGIASCHLMGFITYLIYLPANALPGVLFFLFILVKDLIFCAAAKLMGKSITKALKL